MSNDTDGDEEGQADRPTVVRRTTEEAAGVAASKLSPETRGQAVEWVIRVGLGPLFVEQNLSSSAAATPEEVGALLSIQFDPEADAVHSDLWDRLYRDATGKVVLDPTEARELADHLADYDILKRKDADEDPGQTEVFEWATELRRREGEATEE